MVSALRRKLTAAGILTLAVLATRTWAAPPAVLQEVPDDVGAVLVVRDMRELSNKLSNMATRFQIPAPPDLLGVVTQRINLAKGFDPSGSAAIFWIPPAKDAKPAPGPNRPFVMLLPTTDAKGMLEGYKPTDPDQGISSVTLPNEDQPPEGFVALMDKDGKVAADAKNATFVAFAQNKDVLQRYVGHTKSLAKILTPEDAKSFETNDVVLYANVPTFSEQALGGVAMARMMVEAQQANMPGDEKTLAVQEVTTGMMFDLAKRVLSDAQTGLVTFRLNDTGATLGSRYRFKPDSPVGKFVAAQKTLAAVNLDGLPGGDLFGAMNMTWDPVTVSDLVGQIGSQIVDLPELAQDPSLPKLKKSFENQKQMIAMGTSAKVAFYKPVEPKDNGFVRAVGIMEVTDSAKYTALLRESIKNVDGMMNPQVPNMQMAVTSNDKVLTVKGAGGKEVGLDKYTIKFTFQAVAGQRPTPQARQAEQMIQMIYGKNGFTYYAGELGPNQIIFVLGGDDKLAQDAVTAALNNVNDLTNGPMLTAVRPELLANPSLVAILPVDRWVALGAEIMRANFGGPAGDVAAPPAVAPSPTPVAISLSPAGGTVSSELFVPATVVSAIVETFKPRVEVWPR